MHLWSKSSMDGTCIRHSVFAYLCTHTEPRYDFWRNRNCCFWQVPEESSTACSKFCCFCQWSKSENWQFSDMPLLLLILSNSRFSFPKIFRLHKKHCLWWEPSEHMEQKEKNFGGCKILFKIRMLKLAEYTCWKLVNQHSRLICIMWFPFLGSHSGLTG